jgi:hypothetical protein
MSKGAIGHPIEVMSSVASRSDPTSSNSGHVAASPRIDAIGQQPTLRKNPRGFAELFHLNSISAIALAASWACAAVHTGKTAEFANSFSKGAK